MQIGTGHVMRCLALAQEWHDRGGSAQIVCAQLTGNLAYVLKSNGLVLVECQSSPGSEDDARNLAEIALEVGADWVAVDGELFSPQYLSALRGNNFRVLVIDDLARHNAAPADVVLNQNLNAQRNPYVAEGRVRYLLGVKYALLRKEVRSQSPKGKHPGLAGHLLVSLGGTDPDGLSLRILRACEGLAPTPDRITVVTGSGNPRLPELRNYCSSLPQHVSLVVDAEEIAGIMVHADMAVIAAGGTLWELLHLGCPVLSYSRNALQSEVITYLAAQGSVYDLGSVESFSRVSLCESLRSLASSPEKRSGLSAAGRRMIDGLGTARVVDCLLQPEGRS